MSEDIIKEATEIEMIEKEIEMKEAIEMKEVTEMKKMIEMKEVIEMTEMIEVKAEINLMKKREEVTEIEVKIKKKEMDIKVMRKLLKEFLEVHPEEVIDLWKKKSKYFLLIKIKLS